MNRHLARTLLFFTAVAPLAACSAGSVDGEVNGREVPLFRDAVYIEGDGLGGDDELFNVVSVMTTYPNACDVLTLEVEDKTDIIEDLIKDLEEAASGDDVDDAFDNASEAAHDAEEALPANYHVATFILSIEDDSDLRDGSLDTDGDEGEGFRFVVCEQDGEPDVDFDDVIISPLVDPSFLRTTDDDARTCGISDDGQVNMKHTPRESFQFDGDAELVDAADPDDDAGDVLFEGRANYCPSLKSAFDDFRDALRELNDLANG